MRALTHKRCWKKYSSCKLHPNGKLRVDVDLDAGTATFFVDGTKHKHVATGISGPVRGAVWRYASSKTIAARILSVPGPRARAGLGRARRSLSGHRLPPPPKRC